MNALNRLCLNPALAAACFVLLFGVAWAPSVHSQDLFKRDSDKEKQSATNSDSAQTTTTQPTATDTTSDNSASKGNYLQGDDGWIKIEGSAAKATFQLPQEPKYKTVKFSPIADREAITTHIYISVINPQQSLVFSWHDLHDEPLGNAEIKETLDGAVKGNVARVLGQLDRMESVKVEGQHVREFDYSFSMKVSDTEEKILKSTSRIILVGQRQYQIQMITTEDKVDKTVAAKAFEAFKLDQQ